MNTATNKADEKGKKGRGERFDFVSAGGTLRQKCFGDNARWLVFPVDAVSSSDRENGEEESVPAKPPWGRRFGRRGRRSERIAAVDLGTNNCRLLIARPVRHGFEVIDSFSRAVRLGQGMSETGELSEEAVVRTIDALRTCAGKMRCQRVSRYRSVATEAARSARNRDDFVARVRRETGIRLEIISSREEAELTLAGCRSLLDTGLGHALMFDVGGGSAEFVWARMTGGVSIEGCTSLPCGVVALTEKLGGSDFTPRDYEAVVHHVMDLLLPFDLEFGISRKISEGGVQMLGTAGAVTTVAAVSMSLPSYRRSRVDGYWLEFDAARKVSRELAANNHAERAANPCIGRNRADLVVAGCAVLEAVFRIWPVGRLRVADRGLREGILNVMTSSGSGMREERF